MKLNRFYFISMIINIAPNRKILNYGYRAQAKDFITNLIPAFIMGACIYPISFIEMEPIFLLLVQTGAGILICLLIAVVTKNESYRMTLRFVKQIFKRRSKSAT